jgi:ABC-2 type transport system permease protein
MNKTLIICRHELLVTLKRTSFILATLAVPVLLIVGYGIYQGVQHWYHPTEPETKAIGYVDHAGGFDEYGTQFGVALVSFPDEDEATQALVSREIAEYFVIPEDYLSTGLITRYTMQRELEMPQSTFERIRAFLVSNLVGTNVTPEVLERAKTPVGLTSIRMDENGEVMVDQEPFLQLAVPYIFGLLLMLSIFFASGFLLQSISEEKDNRLMEVLLSSVSARQLLVGKVLGLGAAGLFQIAVWAISIWVFADVALSNVSDMSGWSVPPSALVLALVYYVMGYLLFAVIMAVLGSIGTTARESQSWSSIVAVTTMLPMFFISVIVENPNHALAVVLTLIPTTAPLTAVMRLSSEGIPAWQLGLSLALLASAIVFFMWAGAKVLRACLLMYGKRPSLREITRYIREA